MYFVSNQRRFVGCNSQVPTNGGTVPSCVPFWARTDTLVSWRYAGGARLQDQALATLRGQLADIISGAVFVFVGLAACGIAAMRRRSGVRALIWWGIWSAMYGALRLGDSIAAAARLPHWFQVSVQIGRAHV